MRLKSSDVQNPVRKSDRRKELLHKNLKKPIQNDPILSQWPLGALVALAASWEPPGTLLGASWEPSGSFLGASWESLVPLGSLLGAFWERDREIERERDREIER